MKKNSFRLIFFFVRIVICFYLFSGFSFAATLRWSPVESTESCEINGYKIHYGTVCGQFVNVIDVGKVTFYNLDELELTPTQTYYFAVSAYSTDNLDGSVSSCVPFTPEEPIQSTDNPEIVSFPQIDYINEVIEVVFSEGNMIGGDVKANYLFSPAIPFDVTKEILNESKTYTLFMSYIPEHTIFKMIVTNVTDSSGNILIADSIILNDDDNDQMPDDWEADYGIESAFLDADSDGLNNRLEYAKGTSPVNTDSDGDGMDDCWEIQNSLDPLVDDASDDIDGDGISNIEEYNDGSDVLNSAPQKPVPISPVGLSSGISLTPKLRLNPYFDQEGDTHSMTQWQISLESSFANTEDILFDGDGYDYLTSLTVPEYILDPNETYFWRARFYDVIGGRSLWSDPVSFTTISKDDSDLNKNGVPDNLQIVDGTVDVNADGVFDESTDLYKLVLYNDISIGLQGLSNVSEVTYLKTLSPDDIPDSVGRPTDMALGLIQFKLKVENSENPAYVKIYFSEAVGKKWYKYDLINGWYEYSSDYTVFGDDGKSVRLTLFDGEEGDGDGVKNGIIVDPSGPGGFVSAVSGSSGSGSVASGGGGGGGCFIATAAFGSPIEKHVQVLKDFRDLYLLKFKAGSAFVKTYYKYSPPIADTIAGNNIYRFLVRIALMPLIVFGYILVYMSPTQQLCLVFMFVFSIKFAWKIIGLWATKKQP